MRVINSSSLFEESCGYILSLPVSVDLFKTSFRNHCFHYDLISDILMRDLMPTLSTFLKCIGLFFGSITRMIEKTLYNQCRNKRMAIMFNID